MTLKLCLFVCVLCACQWCFSCVRSWRICSRLVCRRVSESLMILGSEPEPCWWGTNTHTHGYKLSVTFFKVELTREDKYCLCAFRSNSAKWWHPRRSLCGCSLRGPTPPLCPKTPSASSSKTEMTSDRTCSSCRWVSASTVSDTHKWLKKGRSRSVSCRVPSDSADHGIDLGDWITGSLSVTVRLHLHWEQNRSACQILKSDQTNITDTVWYMYFLPPSLLLYLRYDWDREGRHHHR